MAFYAVDVGNHVIERVTQQYAVDHRKRVFLVEAVSAKQAWAKAGRVPDRLAAPVVSAATIATVKFAQNTPSQKDTRTIGFVTAAVS